MIRWEWNAVKAASNLRKHGVSFSTAVQAVLDPLALVMDDPHPDGDRWRIIGKPNPGRPELVFVVHTEPVLLNAEWVGRIISARDTTPFERKMYEEG